jgi:hypothetical protein
VGPRAGLNAVERRKIPSPLRESNTRTLIFRKEVSGTELYACTKSYNIRGPFVKFVDCALLLCKGRRRLLCQVVVVGSNVVVV